jgi:hypothetical protein
MLIGAVLEDGLRRIAEEKDVEVTSRDALASLSHRLEAAGLYNRLKQTQLQVWIRIRNDAAHGHFDEYALADVQQMHLGVSQFLAEYL